MDLTKAEPKLQFSFNIIVIKRNIQPYITKLI